MKKHLITRKTVLISLTIATVISANSFMVYANSQGLPHGSIVTDDGKSYLKDEKGNTHSGWFIDSNKEWFYFDETDKAMKTGWHHDNKDGYWYYLNPSDGKMETGWRTINEKEYFFQPVRDMGNYHFNNEQEKWLYSLNSKVPYGAMYVSTTTPNGANVDETGAKIVSTVHSLKNGWAYENGEWYYYESDVMVKDRWLKINGKWYFVENNGSMVSDSWKEIGGKSYYFGSDGTLYVNSTTPDGNSVDQNGAKIINDIENNEIMYDDFIGTYFYESDYDSMVKIAQDSFNGDVNKAVKEITGMRGYQYFSIKKVENGYIYGEYHMHGSFDGEESSFLGGIKLNDNEFTIIVDYQESGNNVNIVGGLRDSIEDSFPLKCQLTYEERIPALIINGKSNAKFPETSDYVSHYENAIFKKIIDEPIEE